MANTYVTISTPAGNVVKISEATSNKIVASGNTIKVISVGAQGPAGQRARLRRRPRDCDH